MRPTLVQLEDVAAIDNLHYAYWRAASGHRHQPEVKAFGADLDRRLDRLAAEILAGSVAIGAFRRFTIRDPKVRTIHAPPFEERVLHHALMRHVEPILERALCADTFACRPQKGSLAAVLRAQQHLRRLPFFVKVDVRRYFDSIDHTVLSELLRRRVAGRDVLALCDRIIGSYQTAPGKGLPIGALPSQHFANLYLGPFDRWLEAHPDVGAMVRYMDDVIWWCRDRARARETLLAARVWLRDVLQLELKDSAQVHATERGLSLCGFRIHCGVLRLSARRRRRYAAARRAWEGGFERGEISAGELQRGIDAVLAVTAHADAVGWRQGQLARVPPVDA